MEQEFTKASGPRHGIIQEGEIKRVLIAEDDEFLEPFWREFFKRTFGPELEVTWASSLQNAEYFIADSLKNDSPFDLIISDIFFDEAGTGIELWRKYKDDFPKRIVLVSAVHVEKFNQYFRNQNEMPLYLQKPFTFAKCVDFIKGTFGDTRHLET